MKFPRSSGILLHPTSLPGAIWNRRIGTSGVPIHRFPFRFKAAVMAGFTIGAHRIWGFPLSEFLRLRRESPLNRFAEISRRGIAGAVGPARCFFIARNKDRLWACN